MRDTDPAPISYLVLFFVITLAVTCGNLLSNWITARVAAHAMEKASAELARTFAEQAKQATANTNAAIQRNHEAQRQAHQRARQERANSPTGTKLARQCSDWHRAYEDLKSETALHQKNWHCNAYEHYLETGNVKLDLTIRPGK